MKTKYLVLLLLTVGIAVNVTAAPSQIPLTVTVEGDGTVTREPDGIACQTDCTATYKKGTTVTLTATDPNSSFLGWEGACVGTDPICVIKVNAPTNVTAFFDTAVVPPLVSVLKTGQTLCWGTEYPDIPCFGTGEDGEYQAGVAQPTPRFIDNSDGTVTDNVTGLIWLQQPKCLSHLTWTEALDAANNLAAGQCGLTDGSVAGDWRLPNAKELQSLSTFEEPQPPPPPGSTLYQMGTFIYVHGETCGFSGVDYWSSTSLPGQPNLAYTFYQRTLRAASKIPSTTGCAFAVKGGL